MGPEIGSRGQLSLTAPEGENVYLSIYQDNDWKAYLWWDDSEGDLRLQNYTLSSTNINPYGGNVGIGTIQPDATLDVDGDLHVRGNLLVDGGNVIEELLEEIQLLKDMVGIGAVADIDGNVYKTVKIGEQIWMAENLKVTHFADGLPIPLVEGSSEWAALGTSAKAYCYYNNSDLSGEKYGALYTWPAAVNGTSPSNSNPSGIQGVCPDGWHLPSDAEWKELEIILGMSQADADAEDWRGTDEGGKLKEAGYANWIQPNTGATNETGFTALPGGDRPNTGEFEYEGQMFGIWTSSEYDTTHGRDRRLFYDNAGIRRGSGGKGRGFSVRCVKDQP